jgi:predicted SnoaL-like aldol condensation-catalyzing enzyme
MPTTKFRTAAGTLPCARVTALAVVLSLSAAAAPASAQSYQVPSSSDAQEAKNAELVLKFYRTIFDDRKVAEAFEKYATPDYAQHSPLATDVPSTIQFLQTYLDATPDHWWEVKRVLADGDLVALHVHSRVGEGDPGRAIVDIFRVANDRVVEHWEVIQPVVEMENRSMF